MLTWRTRNPPCLPLHKEARDSQQRQPQLITGGNSQPAMEMPKRQKEARAGRQQMFSWPPGSWGHSWAGPPTPPGHQHLTAPSPLPAQLPALLLGIPCYSSLEAFHRAAVVRSHSRMLSRLGLQDFSEQRKELYGHHLILLIFWPQVVKENPAVAIFIWEMPLKDFQAVVC